MDWAAEGHPSNAQTYNCRWTPTARRPRGWSTGRQAAEDRHHPSRNTSGLAYGNGCVWMGANADPYGIFQVDMNSKPISHRQIPLSIDGNGGGCHGVKWHDGKLWIAALRLGGIICVDPATWVPES